MDTITTAVRPAVRPPGRRQAGALPTQDEDFVRNMRRQMLGLHHPPRHRAPGPALGPSTTPATLALLRGAR